MRHDRPSTTALLIGLSLLSLHARRDPASPISDDDARLLRGAFQRLGGRARALAWLAARPSAAPLVRMIEWLVAPGMIRHFGNRKQLIEACAEHAVAAGCGRVVVLAAGLDLLTLHLARRHPALARRAGPPRHPTRQA
jgi:O-methyltransferase involved in polyketide biosynthesis